MTHSLLLGQILLKKVSLSSTESASNAGEFMAVLATLKGGTDNEWKSLLTDLCPEGQTMNSETEWNV